MQEQHRAEYGKERNPDDKRAKRAAKGTRSSRKRGTKSHIVARIAKIKR